MHGVFKESGVTQNDCGGVAKDEPRKVGKISNHEWMISKKGEFLSHKQCGNNVIEFWRIISIAG